MKILAVPGSQRPDSSSRLVLKYIAGILPPENQFILFEGLNDLPHFDDRMAPSPAVTAWRRVIIEADVVIICSPEYAFGLPGTLKNALDWTVSSGEFVDKITALIIASTSGEHAFASLKLVLSALSAKTHDQTNLHFPFIRAKIKDGELADPAARDAVKLLVNELLKQYQTTE